MSVHEYFTKIGIWDRKETVAEAISRLANILERHLDRETMIADSIDRVTCAIESLDSAISAITDDNNLVNVKVR